MPVVREQQNLATLHLVGGEGALTGAIVEVVLCGMTQVNAILLPHDAPGRWLVFCSQLFFRITLAEY